MVEGRRDRDTGAAEKHRHGLNVVLHELRASWHRGARRLTACGSRLAARERASVDSENVGRLAGRRLSELQSPSVPRSLNPSTRATHGMALGHCQDLELSSSHLAVYGAVRSVRETVHSALRGTTDSAYCLEPNDARRTEVRTLVAASPRGRASAPSSCMKVCGAPSCVVRTQTHTRPSSEHFTRACLDGG